MSLLSFMPLVSENVFTCVYVIVLLIGCGHCKALIPVYEEVATTFKNDENV